MSVNQHSFSFFLLKKLLNDPPRTYYMCTRPHQIILMFIKLPKDQPLFYLCLKSSRFGYMLSSQVAKVASLELLCGV